MNAAAVVVVVAVALAGEDKVEEVDLDALEDDKKPAAVVTPAASGADDGKGSTVVEEVDLDGIDASVAIPDYDRRPWLPVLPLLCLLIVMWNVDWRDARIKGELRSRREAKAPKKKPQKAPAGVGS